MGSGMNQSDISGGVDGSVGWWGRWKKRGESKREREKGRPKKKLDSARMLRFFKSLRSRRNMRTDELDTSLDE